MYECEWGFECWAVLEINGNWKILWFNIFIYVTISYMRMGYIYDNIGDKK